jgi:TrmH family RNA methyltransferase
VKAVRKLSGRSARVRAGQFIVEGPRSVREAVAAHVAAVTSSGEPPERGAVRQLFVTPTAEERFGDLLVAAAGVGIHPQPVTPGVLAAMAGDEGSVTPQGLLAVCDSIEAGLPDAVRPGETRLVVVLAHVRDPGNAGTVIRTADAAGADAVVVTDASVDVHGAKCVRSTAGSLFHLPIATGVPLPDAVAALKDAGLTVFAADGGGATTLDDLLDAAAAGEPGGIAGPVAWVLGNEAWGLPADDRALADAVVRVPLYGQAESLNVATAAAVCLYATARAQRAESRARSRFGI